MAKSRNVATQGEGWRAKNYHTTGPQRSEAVSGARGRRHISRWWFEA